MIIPQGLNKVYMQAIFDYQELHEAKGKNKNGLYFPSEGEEKCKPHRQSEWGPSSVWISV